MEKVWGRCSLHTELRHENGKVWHHLGKKTQTEIISERIVEVNVKREPNWVISTDGPMANFSDDSDKY
jgi:hypothetical protein